jgi:hypothetical protein
MASNINQNTIDASYPVAGQDNDSQGFRDNFFSIKNNFAFAKSEIDDLQNKAIVKSALSGVPIDNDMNGNQIRSARILDFREQTAALGAVSGTVAISHRTGGHYQSLTTDGNVTLVFTDSPPTATLGRIRVAITVSSASHTVTLPNAVATNVAGIRNLTSGNVLKFSSTGTYIYEFTTVNNGTSFTINDLSRSRVAAEARTPAATGQLGDVPGMIAYDVNGDNIYICLAEYDGTTVIWKKAALSAV